MSGPWAMLLDAAWMALLLLVGQLLRTHLRVFQFLYLPSAVTAGLLGLVLGPQVLGWIPFSDDIASYAWLLVVLLFASFPFSTPPVRSPRDIMRRAGPTFFFNMSAEVGLFSAALVLGGIAVPLFFPSVEASFPLLLPAGFVGGHAYAASIGGTLQRYAGFESAIAVGYTFATIGIISSIVIGVPLIRWAMRKEYTSSAVRMEDLPEHMRTGRVARDVQLSLGRATISSSSMDPLALHLAVIAVTALAGVYSTQGIQALTENAFGFSVYLPEVATAMVAGLLVRFVLARLGFGEDQIDADVVNRIGGTVTDWLVGFGIAAIKLSVVAHYLPAVALMVLIGFCTTLAYVLLLSRRFFDENWFERGIFVFGWCTGVVAMGITLLRIADPDHRSGTLEAYGLAYVLIAPLELVMISAVPVFVGQGYYWETTLTLVSAFAVLLTAGLRVAQRRKLGLEAKG